MATTKDNEEIIQLLDTAKYLLRGHKQNLNVQWSIDKINQAIKALKTQKEQCVSCLEKQGEQKSADEVNPKFKVGNWYQCTKDFFGKGVTFDKNTAYYCAKEGCLQNKYGCHIAIVKDLYDNFKLWTIQDAKDGDVIFYDDGWTCIFKHIHGIWYSSYCFITADGEFHTGYEEHAVDAKLNGNANPATKEQRDLLFQKMKKAGYEWNPDEKRLIIV